MEEYYFNFDYKSGELNQYIIAHYKGFSNGRIQVLSSDSELFKNIKESVENALYQVKIGFIIVGSVLFFAIVVAIVFSIIICKRLKVINEYVGYAPIQQNKGNNNFALNPLIPPESNNQNYQVNPNQ